MNYTKKILNNGLRTLSVPLTSPSATLAFYISTGSRYEKKEESGISHFLEHMLFKGSENYPTAKDIFGSVERLGGILNGWTDLEATAYWIKVPQDNVLPALKVLSDLVFRPLIDGAELERERRVVLEEINRRNDHPAELNMEILQRLLWPNQPLGRPTLGSPESLRSIDKPTMESYYNSQYVFPNMIFSIAGSFDKDAVFSHLEKEIPTRSMAPRIVMPKVEDKQATPRVFVNDKKTDQANLAIGFHSLASNDPRRFVLEVLSAVLGEGASSRLFQNIREKLGLAYAVGSDTGFLKDTGEIDVAAGLTTEKVELAVSEILKELEKFKTHLVTEDELSLAKAMLKGHLLLSLEDSHSVLDFYTKQELLVGEVLSPEEAVARVEKVTATEIEILSRDLFKKEKLNLALTGPFVKEKTEERLKNIVELFN